MIVRIIEITPNDAFFNNKPERFINSCGIATEIRIWGDGTMSCFFKPLSKKIPQVYFHSIVFEALKRSKK
jgi:hypothetical protein